MRFVIIESGGKQYRAVEGATIEVDRLPLEPGKQFELDRILLMADGDEVLVGTPTVSDILVKALVVEHFKGPKVVRFKYRPKKRIRVKSGHRHQYTRLMIDFIGKPGEERKVEEPAARQVTEETTAEAAQSRSPEAGAKKVVAKKATASKTSSKPAAKKTGKK